MKKKSGKVSYRASITFRNKHISLGSFDTEISAHQAYLEANQLLRSPNMNLEYFESSDRVLTFHRWVVLINFRDNNVYIKTPIYMKYHYFIYYITKDTYLKFDVDDLFYYSNHTIMKRGGHLFVSDFGMQVNILSRYGIKNFAVPGRDYLFANGDSSDYRYGNIKIINPYYGVTKTTKQGRSLYVTKIHVNGNFIVGRYPTETEAAVAYNKAADLLCQKGVPKNYPRNYIDGITKDTYYSIYDNISISNKLINNTFKNNL